MTRPSNRPVWAALLLMLSSCDSKSSVSAKAVPTILSRADLPEDRVGVVLARVGDRTITLGDYVNALERMDSFERLRYQTKERRKLLLDEMIEIELLAREAERLGLDREPRTQAILQQLLREEVLRGLSKTLPRPEDLPASEVAAYHANHPAEFSDPERRRVAVIALRDEASAKETLAQVASTDAKRWGEVARERSLLASSKQETQAPLEFEGDLGLTSAPGETRGRNPRIPDEVANAAFQMEELGVFPEVVRSGNRFYVVRLLAKTPARKRTLDEADTVIRVRLVEERLAAAEAALQEELAKKYPIEIDEAALLELKAPAAGPERTAPVPTAAPSARP